MWFSGARYVELCHETVEHLWAQGYRGFTIHDIKLQLECILNAIEDLETCRDSKPYEPIHKTAYYRENGSAYLAAQQFIFEDIDIQEAQFRAARNRRGLMLDSGTWTTRHEEEYRANYID